MTEEQDEGIAAIMRTAPVIPVIVIDEIGTSAEAMAARTIAERGVQLIATAHGNTLENLLQNPTLSDLVGGIQAGLWRFPANGAPVPLCAGHPRLDVWTLARAAPDLLWVATNDGLYRVDGAGDCRREDGAAEALHSLPRPPGGDVAEHPVPTVRVRSGARELIAVPPPLLLDGRTIERDVPEYAAAAPVWRD